MLLAAGIVAYFIDPDGTLAWMLLLAIPPAYEGEISRRAISIAGMIYDRSEDQIERAVYRPGETLVRCCFLFVFFTLAYALGRGGLDRLPDNYWILAFIVIPIAAHLAWVAAATRKNVVASARLGR